MKHVLVVGAGLIGSAIAFRLVQAGARVTLVDRAGPAAGASGVSFGWINASFFSDADHHHLRVAGIAAHRRWHDSLPAGVLAWQRALWFEEQGAEMARFEVALRDLNYPVERIEKEEFSALEPHVVAPQEALCFSAEGVADSTALTQAVFAAATSGGTRAVLGVAVQGLFRRRGRICGVATDQGEIAADEVVIAAGTGAQGLIGLPMLKRPGLLMKTNILPPVLAHVLVTPEGEVKQDAQGRLVMPTAVGHQADDAAVLAADPSALADAALVRLQRLFPGVNLQWTEVALANRPVPRDGLPVIGAVEPGLYAAVMHSGVTLAAITAEYASKELLEGQRINALGPYRPGRF